MCLMNKVEKRIKTLEYEELTAFSDIHMSDIPKDTIRKYLHRFHDRGIISIVNRGYFKRIKPFCEYLFVYGSLKKGFDNHKLLDKYTRRLGKAKTISKFAMYEDSFGNYPYLIKMPISKIEGELYEIHREEMLDKIDEFEGAPDYYYRKKIQVKTHKGVKFAHVYLSTKNEIPNDQNPIKVWKNNSDYKVEQLKNYLKEL